MWDVYPEKSTTFNFQSSTFNLQFSIFNFQFSIFIINPNEGTFVSLKVPSLGLFHFKKSGSLLACKLQAFLQGLG